VKDLLLSIDLGTQSVRALLFDLQGRLVARAQQGFDDYQQAEPGWMTHDGEAFWRAAAACCRQLKQHAARVAGIAVTTQRGSIVPVDAQGACLAPAICWPDQRRATELPPLSPLWRAAFSAAGVRGTIDAFQRDAEANWWRQHQPQLAPRTHKLLLLSGLLNHRLTGRFVDSVGSQVAYLPFDYRRQTWAAQSGLEAWKWQALAVQPEWLCELVPVGSQLGELTPAAAALTGLPVGTPVMAAAADKACEVLGAGALEPNIGALSYGTTATINQTLPRYVEPEPFVPPYPAAVAGHYSAEVQITRGFWLVSWFREQFGHPERAAAAELGIAPEALFDELIANIPPGSLGLTLLPTWGPGIRTPGPEARGAIIGFTERHTRAHLYRAILEGLAYALREGAERLQKRSGVAFTALHASGGGAQSDAALQLSSDVFKHAVGRPHTHETSGLGAAICAAVGLGLHGDTASAVREMTRIQRWFEPQAEAVARYEQLYAEVYTPLYGRLQPLFERLRRIAP
jgi:sugar (pentulose or hexulose) kinase